MERGLFSQKEEGNLGLNVDVANEHEQAANILKSKREKGEKIRWKLFEKKWERHLEKGEMRMKGV